MKSLRWILVLSVAVMIGCGSTPDYPQPTADKGQLLVTVLAKAKTGVKAPEREASTYSAFGTSIEKGRHYTRIDYGKLSDIIVWLDGRISGSGPAPTTNALTIDEHGFNREQVLLGPSKHTQLTITNRLGGTATVFCLGDSGDGFDVEIPAGGSTTVSLSDPGTYELLCDEVDAAACDLVVAPTTWAREVRSGRSAFFDGLSAGAVDVVVQAPELPPVRTKASVTVGARKTVKPTVGVNALKRNR